MTRNREALTGGGTLARARKVENGNYHHDNTTSTTRQVHVADLLHRGADHPTSCRELVDLLGWRDREVTRAIEQERRNGTPIAANGQGYYLAATDAELESYLRSLTHREHEIRLTREALAATLQQRFDFTGVNS